MLYDKRWDNKIEVDAVGQALLNAAAYIEHYGWCQHVAMEDDGRVCVVGAINMANADRWFYSSDSNACLRCADRLFDALGHKSVVEWNDTPGRTKDEVIALLRKAATLDKS